MDADRYEFIKNRLIATAELARETCAEIDDFLNAIPFFEESATSRDVYALVMDVRTFREVSAGALAALLAERHKARAIR